MSLGLGFGVGFNHHRRVGVAPPPGQAMKFNLATNSQYLPLLTEGL